MVVTQGCYSKFTLDFGGSENLPTQYNAGDLSQGSDFNPIPQSDRPHPEENHYRVYRRLI